MFAESHHTTRIVRAVVALAMLGMLATPAQAQLVKGFQKISDTEGGFEGVLNDGHFFGTSVAAIGDLDGDGVGDVVVGGNGDNENGWLRGAIWVLFLNEDGTVRAHQKINESNGGFTATLSDTEHFGTSIAPLGDLNRDGVIDLAVSGFGHNNIGAVWILFMKPDGQVDHHREISQNTGGFTGSLSPGNRFGHAVAKMGDIDGDGVVDLAVGTWADDDGGPDRGAVWILFLNTDGTVKKHQKISSTQGGFAGPLDNGDIFGVTVANIGDLDRDGIDELAVGAIYDDDGGTGVLANRGAVWILFLNPNGTVRTHQKISDTEGGFTGILDDEDFFAGPAGIGDLDLDGIPDLAVGTIRDDDLGSDAGSVWLLFLRRDGTVRYHQKIAKGEGALSAEIRSGDQFGSSIANLGDVDGNGVQDLAVWAVFDKDGGWLHGALYVLFMNRPGVTGFTLIDAETDLPVPGFDPMPANATLNIKRIPRHLNIRANVAGSYESVRFAFDGNANFRTENEAPYALFGDVNGDYALGAFRLGEHRLRATPYTGNHASGEAGAPLEITFTVVREDPGMEVTALTLVNASTDTDIRALYDGAELDLAVLPPSLNVRADVVGPVESVRFTLGAYSRVEETPPYALFGDLNGNYSGGVLPTGNHTLTATPFRQPGAKGSAGQALSIDLVIVDGAGKAAAPADGAYPNPFNPTTTIRYTLATSGRVKVTVFDMLGREVRVLVDGIEEAGPREVSFDAGDLPSGMYLYRIETPTAVQTHSLMLLK